MWCFGSRVFGLEKCATVLEFILGLCSVLGFFGVGAEHLILSSGRTVLEVRLQKTDP
jgi:hypothetical protein